MGLELLAGKEPQEIVESIAHLAVDVLAVRLQEGRVDEPGHKLLSLLNGGLQQHRCHPWGERRALQQSEQAKQPLLLVAPRLVADGQAGPDLAVSQP